MKRFTSDRSQNLTRSTDPFVLHRAALTPVLYEKLPSPSDCPGLENPTAFASFLFGQRLQGLWLDLISSQDTAGAYTALAEHLAGPAKTWTALELPQGKNLSTAHNVLSKQGIPYFIAKGFHLRHVYYEQPILRSAIDIDLFVHEADREAAVRSLQAAGFTAHPLDTTMSHEIKLTRHHSDIDLHWHLLRPGRFRPGLMNWLFAHREQFGDFWGLDATASLLVMLVHPAITKYLVSPTSMLIHQVDQARLMQSGKVDWGVLESALHQSHGRTAAWSSLYLLKKLGGIEVPGGFEQKIKPGKVHAWYLQQWIDNAWITKHFEKRWMVAGSFSLALQESVGDAVRATWFRT